MNSGSGNFVIITGKLSTRNHIKEVEHCICTNIERGGCIFWTSGGSTAPY